MSINAIDTHCHIHYAPLETLKPLAISDVMHEGSFYTAYWDTLSQMEKTADYILPYANAFPNVTFIMAHLGGVGHINAIRDAKHKNVYADTSGKASLKNMLIEYAVSQVGSDRILYGAVYWAIAVFYKKSLT